MEGIVRHHQQLVLELTWRSGESFASWRWKKSVLPGGAAQVKAPSGKAHSLSVTAEWMWGPEVAIDGPEQRAGQLDGFLSTCKDTWSHSREDGTKKDGFLITERGLQQDSDYWLWIDSPHLESQE